MSKWRGLFFVTGHERDWRLALIQVMVPYEGRRITFRTYAFPPQILIELIDHCPQWIYRRLR
jgi:hypothetical protein